MNDLIPFTSEVLLDSILTNIGVGIFWKDKDRKFLGVNKFFLDYYGITLADVVGKNDEEMKWHVNPKPFKSDEIKVIKDGEVICNARGNCIIRGENRNIVANKFPVYDKKTNEIIGLWGYFVDVTEVDRHTHQLEDLVLKDPLTGLLNRRGLDTYIEEYEKMHEINHIDYAVFFLDINKFKIINDTYGHGFGDDVLIKVAIELGSEFGENNIVARIGGDEFCIVAQIESKLDIDAIKSRIIGAFNNIEYVGMRKIKVSTSIGAASSSETGIVSELIELADRRMYEEKRRTNAMR